MAAADGVGKVAGPQQRVAYVGSYTGFVAGQLGWVGTSEPGVGISIFAFDEVQGTLTGGSASGTVVAQDCPTWLEVDPTATFLVAVHELSHHTGAEAGVGFLSSYRIEPDGGLTKVCTTPTSGRGNTCVTFDRTGRFVLTTRYWEGGIAVLPFDPATGVIAPATSTPVHEGTGPHPLRQAMPHPHGIHGDPNTDIVYAMDLGTDAVHQYTLDTSTGALTPLAAAPRVAMGECSGPRGMNFHPHLPMAYVNCELSGTVVVCSVDKDTGVTPVQTLLAYPKGFVALDHPDNFGKAAFWGAEGVITRDGRWYYYICRVAHQLAIFHVQPNGTLVGRGHYPLALKSNARNLTLDVTGKHLLVASQDANCVEVFRIDAETGTLTKTDSAHAPCAADVAVV